MTDTLFRAARGAAFLLVYATGVVGSHAHSELRGSEPRAGAALEAAPAQVVLHFNDFVQVTTLRLLDGEGRIVRLSTDGSLAPAREERAGVPPIPPGNWRIDWAAISADGHPISGTIPFSVRGEGAAR